jgi:glutamine cyclotransferase
MCGKRCNCSSKSCKWVSRRNYRPLWSQKNGQNTTAEVLNGIAYNPKTGTIFVTGKNWDKIFEITVSE